MGGSEQFQGNFLFKRPVIAIDWLAIFPGDGKPGFATQGFPENIRFANGLKGWHFSPQKI
jgi:hypothetical protein